MILVRREPWVETKHEHTILSRKVLLCEARIAPHLFQNRECNDVQKARGIRVKGFGQGNYVPSAKLLNAAHRRGSVFLGVTDRREVAANAGMKTGARSEK